MARYKTASALPYMVRISSYIYIRHLILLTLQLFIYYVDKLLLIINKHFCRSKPSFCIQFNIIIFFYLLIDFGASRGAGAKSDCKTDWLWVRTPLEEMRYLFKFIFPFLCSVDEAKRGVEFCHSTRNTSRIRQKVGNRVS